MHPCILIVLDGFGERTQRVANAIRLAKTPVLDGLRAIYPSTLLQASGLAVGLPMGQMGNSEVGHMTLGAGRVVYQDLPRISKSIEDGTFNSHPELLRTIKTTRECGTTLHLMGLVSHGGVHSHVDHALAITRLCKAQGLTKVVWHAFLDGRDTPPRSAMDELLYVENQLNQIGVGRIGSVCGRFYAMDRDHHWERTAKAYHLLVHGQGRIFDHRLGIKALVQSAYDHGETDEFVTPIILTNSGLEISTIQPKDSVIFFNFRADRARQLTSALTQPNLVEFDRGPLPAELQFLSMTRYNPQSDLPVIFPPQTIPNHLGQYLAQQGLAQFRVAETEKYAHVTFFFNCGDEKPYPSEDRILIASRRDVSTYDKAPEMSADGITAALVKAISSSKYSFLLANFANPDMVGHTGQLSAAICAVETIDRCIGHIAKAAKEHGISLVITADHGNCEMMIDPQTQQPHTAHTTNPVPLLLIDERYQYARLRDQAGLKDVAPTLLELMELPIPSEMTGTSLIQ